MTAPLPRSLDPLPEESLPGYLLRLAHRLDLSPARLAHITGLATYTQGARVRAMLALPPATATRFAHATRLTLAEVTGLTLDPLSSRYPPLAPELAGRRRRGSGLFVKETWVSSQHTRYCPHCLAGDGSIIQQRHGGGWSKLWRLTVVFACPTHQRLLEHTCPRCHTPALTRGKGLAMLPRVGDSTLHPTDCRGTEPDTHTEVCRQRLDQAPPTNHDVDLAALLALQNRLLDLLRPGSAAGTTSVGQPATPAQYFLDLRILTCLITASWPITEPLVRDRRHATLIDDHVEQVRRQIAHDDQHRSQPRHNALCDTPPTNTAARGALLAAADAITNAGDADAVRNIAGPMFEAHPRGRTWAGQFLSGDGYCSPGLQDAIGPEVGSRRIMRRTGLPHYRTRRWLLPPPPPVSFHVGHIPQRPYREWMQTFFSGFNDLKPELLADAVVIRLAYTCLGTSTSDATARLRVPQPSATKAFQVVNRALAVSDRHTAFDQAIHDLAKHLDSATDRIDYGKRRDALARWRISRQQWRDLIADMPAQPVRGTGLVPPAKWGDRKRILATVWIWTRLTHGNYVYAPAINPKPRTPRPSGDQVEYIHTRWHYIEYAGTGPGHYARLRERLDAIVERLTQDIDNN